MGAEMKKIKTISVIGLGKLGLPIATTFAENDYKVIGIDIGLGGTICRKIGYKIINIHIGESYKNLGNIIFVVVPTPSMIDDKFTSKIVEDVLDKIKKKQIVVIVSTLMPGETNRLQKKYPHLTLIYNPTFIALGSVAYDFTHPDFVLIGSKNRKATETLQTIYNKILKVEPHFAVLMPLEAEIAKLALNCYITTKITFANQIGNLCYRLNIKPNNILNTIGMDSRIGNKYFKAGLGYGGTCFPRDNLALSAYCNENNFNPTLFKCIDFLNRLQELEIVERIEKLNPKIVGFKSLSFKKGIDITECSPLKEIYEILKNRGYKVKIGKGDVNLDWGGICQK